MASFKKHDANSAAGAGASTQARSVTPEMDRYNGRLYLLCYVLIYFAAPTVYIGIVQAALLNKLGTSHTVANLPAATYYLGCLAPLYLSSVVPYRLERSVVVMANLVTTATLSVVCVTLFLPVSNWIRIATLIGQGVVMGLSAATSNVYMLQCLGRGTTEKGRSQCFKLTFTVGPIAAVVGSLLAQFVLDGHIHALKFPYDFGFLYLISVPCLLGVAFLSSRYQMIWMQEESRPPSLRSLLANVKSYSRNRKLVLLWLGYLGWFFTMGAMPNLSLYAQKAVHRQPSTLSGISMALEFGGHSAGGFALGTIALRYDFLAPVIATVILAGGGVAWAWITPGYAYLLAFALMGAGLLGGVYFPNAVLTLSSPETGARNIALLGLAGSVASVGPAIHGALTDLFGFHASFAFGIAAALFSLLLVSRLHKHTATAEPANGGRA